jgi:hypothetical protein
MPPSRNRFARARIARLLWFAGLSVFLCVYWWGMSNFVLRDFYDPQYATKLEQLKAVMRKHPGRPMWVVMGDSRVEHGLCPAILDTDAKGPEAPVFYNFGMGGAGMFRKFICLRRLIEDGIRPQCVGIEILGATMSRDLYNDVDSPALLVRARRDELGDYAAYSEAPSKFLATWRRSRWDPAFQYGMKLPHQTRAWRLIPIPWIWRLEHVRYDKWGWYPEPPAPIPERTYQNALHMAFKQFAPNFDHFKVSAITDQSLRRMLDLCKERGIHAFLLRMPEGADFRTLYTPEADAAIDSYLSGIENAYHVPMIDATNWIDKAGFTDGHHLNSTGAEEFTRLLEPELEKLKAEQTKP